MLIALLLAATAVLGTAPKKLTHELSHVPNEQAIVRRIWFPGLDAGFVPQGVTFAGKNVLVSGYHFDAATGKSGPPTKVFIVDAASGRTAGSFGLPADVKHAGGLAWAGGQTVFAVDKGLLYKMNFSGKVLGRATLDAGLGGSFVSARGNQLWVGLFTDPKDAAAPAPRLLRIDAAKALKAGKATVKDAQVSFAIAKGAQGVTIGPGGDVWLSQSNHAVGTLQVLDAKTGKVKRSYRTVPGIEDLTFAPDGLLWSVSEAGSLRWKSWDTKFPVIFAIDVAKLKAE